MILQGKTATLSLRGQIGMDVIAMIVLNEISFRSHVSGSSRQFCCRAASYVSAVTTESSINVPQIKPSYTIHKSNFGLSKSNNPTHRCHICNEIFSLSFWRLIFLMTRRMRSRAANYSKWINFKSLQPKRIIEVADTRKTEIIGSMFIRS